MKFLKKAWLIPLLLTIVIIVAGSIYINSLLTKEERMSSDDMRAHLENIYEGTVDNLSMKGDIYIAEMTRTGGVYSAEVDAVSGDMLSMKQLSEVQVESPEVLSEAEIREIVAKKYVDEVEHISLNESGDSPTFEVEVEDGQVLVKVVIDAISGEIHSEERQKTTAENALITREEAIEIALEQLNGEVEYVKFQETDDGGLYLVEIEQDDDDHGDDLEAVFHIHAITGKIMFIEWDD